MPSLLSVSYTQPLASHTHKQKRFHFAKKPNPQLRTRATRLRPPSPSLDPNLSFVPQFVENFALFRSLFISLSVCLSLSLSLSNTPIYSLFDSNPNVSQSDTHGGSVWSFNGGRLTLLISFEGRKRGNIGVTKCIGRGNFSHKILAAE